MSEDQPAVRRRRVNLEPTAEEVSAVRQKEGLQMHEGTIYVQRAAYGVEEERTDTIQVPLFATHPARIRVSAGTTRNLGDYNSARVEVMVEMPCYPVEDEIIRAYNFIESVLDRIIPVELEKAGVPVEG